MIVAKQEEGLRVITQPDHARLAADLLGLWRAGDLPHHPRRDDLLFATREHDNGWREADSAPRVSPESGAPLDFLAFPDAWRRDLWDRATERYADERPAAAALITRHAISIHDDRTADPNWRGWLGSLEERLEAQLEASDLERAELELDYPWLLLADRVSLRACGTFSDLLETEEVRVERRPGELRLEPFPLAGATTFEIPCRHIPDRPYSSDTDLAVELASAKWERISLRIAPAD